MSAKRTLLYRLLTLPRKYSLALSAAAVAVLLLAVLLLASSVQSASRYPTGLADTLAPPSANPLPKSTDSTPAVWPQAKVDAALRSNPVMFIENVGQFAEDARFQVRGGNGTIWLAEDAIWITVLEAPPQPSPTSGREHFPPLTGGLRGDVDGGTEGNEPRRGVNLKLTFPGANPHPRIEPFNRLDTVVSYFIGNDPAKWHPDVPVWGGVRYADLYPGVDLEVTSKGGRWTWRFAVRDSQFAISNVRLRMG